MSVRVLIRRARGKAARTLLLWQRGRGVETKLRTARVMLRAERGIGRADGSRSGRALLHVVPDAISRLAARLPHGVVLVSGTNGKTTATAMITAVLEHQGLSVVTNPTGSNQANGITGALLHASRPRELMQGDYGVFEADERSLPGLVRATSPRVVALGNLFRDQLDRHGEVDIVADIWARMLDDASPDLVLVACADDLRVAALTRAVDRVIFFGLSDDRMSRPALSHAADASDCPSCGVPVVYDVVYLGQLGRYRCPQCGGMRPNPDVSASDVHLAGVDSSSFTLRTPHGQRRVELAVPGVFNVYNAIEAAATLHALGIELDVIAEGLGRVTPVFGRSEVIRVGETETIMLLAKNPTGMDEITRMICSLEVPLDLLLCLNDSVFDGRDVSWIWDADFESIAGRVGTAVCAGSRAAEVALRLKYAGVPGAAICVEDTWDAAISAAARHPRVFAIANYTAMLDLRDALVSAGHARRVWR